MSKVLVIDDEENLLQVISRLLQELIPEPLNPEPLNQDSLL